MTPTPALTASFESVLIRHSPLLSVGAEWEFETRGVAGLRSKTRARGLRCAGCAPAPFPSPAHARCRRNASASQGRRPRAREGPSGRVGGRGGAGAARPSVLRKPVWPKPHRSISSRQPTQLRALAPRHQAAPRSTAAQPVRHSGAALRACRVVAGRRPANAPGAPLAFAARSTLARSEAGRRGRNARRGGYQTAASRAVLVARVRRILCSDNDTCSGQAALETIILVIFALLERSG